ncbi:hypothetical protein KFK09_008690 [Dendrobium nobile]|uniref:Uncharacterized protein n=1 Tax=Dendrobium nobile TaxID=94219 RepID=A0A8T3BNH9_DENNO|nr:hypothetical protein KFK09_008690 [Dendrobium nobile]
MGSGRASAGEGVGYLHGQRAAALGSDQNVVTSDQNFVSPDPTGRRRRRGEIGHGLVSSCELERRIGSRKWRRELG